MPETPNIDVGDHFRIQRNDGRSCKVIILLIVKFIDPASIIETRLTDDGKPEYFVHYVGCMSRTFGLSLIARNQNASCCFLLFVNSHQTLKE